MKIKSNAHKYPREKEMHSCPLWASVDSEAATLASSLSVRWCTISSLNNVLAINGIRYHWPFTLLRDLFLRQCLLVVSSSASLERVPRWLNEISVMLDQLHRTVYQQCSFWSKTLLVSNVNRRHVYLLSFDRPTSDNIHFCNVYWTFRMWTQNRLYMYVIMIVLKIK